MPSKQQLHMSLLTKSNANKYLENLPPLEERRLEEPYYGRQWWEDGYSYMLFTRYYLIQGGKRSISEAYRMFLADSSEDFDPSKPASEVLDPERLPNAKNSDKVKTWIYYHANAQDPHTGRELEGPTMTWEERASFFDLDKVINSRDKMSIYREEILQDELNDYQELKVIAGNLLEILKDRVVEFKKRPKKADKDYTSLAAFAEKIINLRETVDKFGRRGVGLPERISEDRFVDTATPEYKIIWEEPKTLPNGNDSSTGDILVYRDENEWSE